MSAPLPFYTKKKKKTAEPLSTHVRKNCSFPTSLQEPYTAPLPHLFSGSPFPHIVCPDIRFRPCLQIRVFSRPLRLSGSYFSKETDSISPRLCPFPPRRRAALFGNLCSKPNVPYHKKASKSPPRPRGGIFLKSHLPSPLFLNFLRIFLTLY